MSSPPQWWADLVRDTAEIISTPLEITNDKLRVRNPHEEQRVRYLDPDGARIRIYQEQYWMRIFNVLQSEFSQLTKLLTPFGFNQLVLHIFGRRGLPGPGLELVGDVFFQQLIQRAQHPLDSDVIKPSAIPIKIWRQRLLFDEAKRRAYRQKTRPRMATPALDALCHQRVLAAESLTVLRLDPAQDWPRPGPWHVVVCRSEGQVRVDEVDPLFARLLKAVAKAESYGAALLEVQSQCDEKLASVLLERVDMYTRCAFERGYWCIPASHLPDGG